MKACAFFESSAIKCASCSLREYVWLDECLTNQFRLFCTKMFKKISKLKLNNFIIYQDKFLLPENILEDYKTFVEATYIAHYCLYYMSDKIISLLLAESRPLQYKLTVPTRSQFSQSCITCQIVWEHQQCITSTRDIEKIALAQKLVKRTHTIISRGGLYILCSELTVSKQNDLNCSEFTSVLRSPFEYFPYQNGGAC